MINENEINKINEKINRNNDIDEEIKSLKKQIQLLKNEKKSIINYILKNCNHEWELDRSYFQYDERPNKCKKCNLMRF